MRVGPDVWYSLVVVFSLSYLATVLGLPRPLALISLSIGLVFNVLTEVFFGNLSDRLGRRAVYGAGVVVTIIWVFAFFALLDTRQPLLITVAIVVALIAHAMMYGPQAAFITEQFPTRVQFAGSSIGYTLAGIVGGGIAPAIFATLLREFKTPFSIALYAAGALTITGIVLWFSRETAHASHSSPKTEMIRIPINYASATRTSVAMMRAPATNVPRIVPETFDSPPARRRWFTGISTMRNPARAAFICISKFQP